MSIIDEEQKKEIEGLIPDHQDALVNYGADMFNQGLLSGMLYTGAGGILGGLLILGFEKIKQKKNK